MSAMQEYGESSTAAVLSRSDDPITIALRSEGALELQDIVDLQRNASPIDEVLSSVGSIPTAVFSSHKPSSGTKPTSNGSIHPKYHRNGKGKGVVMYASSLSATQGSVSEADAEQERALFGIGDWAGNRPLKGSARACKRQGVNRRPKDKKPVVIVQQPVLNPASAQEGESSAAADFACSSKEPKRSPSRLIRSDENELSVVEEGRGSRLSEGNKPTCMPLSPIRLFILVALFVLIGLTLGLATFAARYVAARYSGKERVASTKGIVYSATVFISSLTVFAMVVARRALHEALLAGLLQCVVGFVLVVEIHEFIV